MKQVRHRMNIRLIADENNEGSPETLFSTMRNRKLYTVGIDTVLKQAISVVHLRHPKVAVGFSMLELSKLTMYEFYYST